MGYKNKKYHKDLVQQVHEKLTKMLHDGEGKSKREAIANETDADKIFSYKTYQIYTEQCKYFARYVRENHPEITNLKKAKKYVNEWLQHRVDCGKSDGTPYSAWTITLERQALGKLYGITPDDPNFFPAPKRKREDIFRSRGDAVRDKNFSEENNDELIKFCRGTGCRRGIMKKLLSSDLTKKSDMEDMLSMLEKKKNAGVILDKLESVQFLALKDALEYFPDHDYFINHRKDKGGRYRYSPIIGKHKKQIIERMQDTLPNNKVWQHVSGEADIHSYRSDYATAIYKMYARPIEEIPYDCIKKGSGIKYQSEVYICRKDEKGKKLDKRAMLITSKALGHNRLEIVANNYIRGL